MAEPLLLGAIEAGGTKFLCAISDRDGHTLMQTRVATTTPDETLAATSTFFSDATERYGELSAFSIGSFGPLSLNAVAADYGCITSTPKARWQNVDLLGHFRQTIAAPMALDTDVNCAALGEWLFGSGQGLDTFCYVTVGTGIGIGLFINGSPHGGANHPEGGHIKLPRAPGDGQFAGICPYHSDCLEGLASGPAIHARWGAPAETLPDAHQAWDIEADYLAGLCTTLTYTVRPDRIIIGGGVMQPPMYDRVRKAITKKLAGYDASMCSIDMADYVAAPTAGTSAGLTGALALAYRTVTHQWPMHWGHTQISSHQSGIHHESRR